MTASSKPLSRLDRLWLAEAVRLTEAHAGLLEDAEANRRARAEGGPLAERVLRRAELLARRDGLCEALLHWRQGASLLILLLALAALVIGAGLAFAAVEEGGRTVNVFWALGSLLGVHLLSLLAWLAGLLLAPGAGALGRLWLWGSARLARDARAAQLAPALLALLGRAGLARWGFGILVHGFWLLVLGAALLTLLGLFSARRYGFNWETTLLSADSFVAFTRALGALPALLGLPVPEAQIVRASGGEALASEAARRLWAGWLLGVVLVYGLLPRLLLAVLCGWRWRRGLARLTPDLALPEYQVLRERLQPGSESLGVRDPAPAAVAAGAPVAGAGQGAGAMLVGIELDEDAPWPPALPAGVVDAGIVNSRAQRQQLLEALALRPPARLLVVCDPRRSVDRGTLKFIAELARSAAATRVRLLEAKVDADRRQEWRTALAALGLELEPEPVADWLEAGHG